MWPSLLLCLCLAACVREVPSWSEGRRPWRPVGTHWNSQSPHFPLSLRCTSQASLGQVLLPEVQKLFVSFWVFPGKSGDSGRLWKGYRCRRDCGEARYGCKSNALVRRHLWGFLSEDKTHLLPSGKPVMAGAPWALKMNCHYGQVCKGQQRPCMPLALI